MSAAKGSGQRARRRRNRNSLPSPIFRNDPLDIRGILHVQKGRIDIPYLRHWSGQMLKEPAVGELDELIATYEADRPA